MSHLNTSVIYVFVINRPRILCLRVAVAEPFLTINLSIVYMARDAMFLCGQFQYSGHWKGWVLTKIETF